MIISHKHKFIFIKPKKVAGTSVEINLAKHCGNYDIVTAITDHSSETDETEYDQIARNDEGFYNHMPPAKIVEKIGKDAWDEYFKFTIIRNPWDKVVSKYHWMMRKRKERIRIFLWWMLLGGKKSKFNLFVKKYKNKFFDEGFYFDQNGNNVCDFYIRYENLEGDYKRVCEMIKIPYEVLPKTKNKVRKGNKHYSSYYDDETKEIVGELFKKEIVYFEHKFSKVINT